MNTLEEYLRDRKCKGFTPVPHYNALGDFIWLYWKDSGDGAYEDPQEHGFSLMRDMGTNDVVGVKIFSVRGELCAENVR